MSLTEFQKKLCIILQQPLSVSRRPFAKIATSLSCDESTVLGEIENLQNAGVVRRISAMISYRSLGKTSTLCTAHVPTVKLEAVTNAVNALDGVSHNYLRDDHYNMWFTLQGSNNEQIENILSNLSSRFNLTFQSLPVTHAFKLRVRFDPDAAEKEPLQNIPITKHETVQLSENEKLILSRLQGSLKPVSNPFDFLCTEEIGPEEVLRIINGLIDKGVIRRITAVLEQHKLGIKANVLFVAKVPSEKVLKAGLALAQLTMVTHCYERKTFEGWPYNLFAMTHAAEFSDIEEAIEKFTRTHNIDSYRLLATKAELKKKPVKHHF